MSGIDVRQDTLAYPSPPDHYPFLIEMINRFVRIKLRMDEVGVVAGIGGLVFSHYVYVIIVVSKRKTDVRTKGYLEASGVLIPIGYALVGGYSPVGVPSEWTAYPTCEVERV